MAGIIGVVGGMGTYAGIDLLGRIADNTPAGKDQEHLPVIMISMPHKIHDRSEYLAGIVDTNPAFAISTVIASLSEAGAQLVALPCNTAHVPEIVNIVEDKLPEGMQLVNMIDEVARFISDNYKTVREVGILGTNGTVGAKVYDHYLAKYGLNCIYPEKKAQYEKVHPAIYNPDYGIKAQSLPVSERSVADLLFVSEELIESGAEVIILGCTEISLAITDKIIFGIPVIDASEVLAKALVRESFGRSDYPSTSSGTGVTGVGS